jgi:hypothetical protein
MNYYITEEGLSWFSNMWRSRIIAKKDIDRGCFPVPDICNKEDCRGSLRGYCMKKLFKEGLIEEIRVLE